LIDLPGQLKLRWVYPVFHAWSLCIHVPNDDRLFPGRLDAQATDLLEERKPEWAIDRILLRKGAKEDATFEVRWLAGDITWLPYLPVSHLDAIAEYFDLLGISTVNELTDGRGTPPRDGPQIFLGGLTLWGPESINTALVPILELPHNYSDFALP
jgi:hypothetical protein